MVTVEVELDEQTVRELSREAAQFEFRGSESYVRWLLDHRALVLSKSDAMADRLSTLEERLTELEGAGDEMTPAPDPAEESDEADGEAVREVIDEWLVVAGEADDDEIEQAVATVEKQGERAPAGSDGERHGGTGEPPEEFVDGTLDEELDL
jgi:hypothetical protein